jgi:4-hydroxy-tetrahydrodipicolinate synthase
MVTPFHDDLQANYDALPALLRWYEARGVAGVFAICQSSEIFLLSYEERLQILRTIVRNRAPGTVVLASGHTAFDLPTQIKEAQGFAAEGIDAYVFISNRFAAQDEDESTFLRRAETLAKALGDTPLGIYECPVPYKRLLPPETIRRLGDIGNFAFLKDTCCNLAQLREKIAAAQSFGLKLFNANAATLLESLRMGASGFSGVMSNMVPQLFARLCAIWQTEPALAERLQAFVGASSLAEYQQYNVNAKYYLQLEGVPMGIASRARDAAQFGANNALEIEQLRTLAQWFESSLCDFKA